MFTSIQPSGLEFFGVIFYNFQPPLALTMRNHNCQNHTTLQLKLKNNSYAIIMQLSPINTMY
jgi:hypothetical protein